MGGAQSREGVLSDSDSDTDTEPETSIDSKLQSLSLNPKPNLNPNAVKLYRHVGGTSPSAVWHLADKLTSFSFTCPSSDKWHLSISPHIQTLISPNLQLKPSPDHLRCDFVADADVWALKFPSRNSFNRFLSGYESCLFENTHGLDLTDDNKARVFGKDYAGWANPEQADDSIWEDAMDVFETENLKVRRELLEEFEEEAGNEGGKIQSLALGALDNSFLVGDSSVQVVRNFSHGVHGKGMSVKFSGTPKKALLMKAESNLLLMSPENRERVRQLDIETGKIVTEWRFEKDGTDITMRDIANDSKGAQLDPSESTFLGLDDSRLCRWDMREKKGIVQDMTSSPVLEWTQGHQFARGTNFQCFASAGDGSIVVGSLDGKIRLYSKNSMRMAKTAFPGLGSPITHVDVTYDGKWVLGTTDTYLLLISTVFKDKDGKEKTGFSGRMGNRIAAPRMLKLTPLDAHLAGKDNKFHGGQFSWVSVFVI